jgi:hypothetical protein
MARYSTEDARELSTVDDDTRADGPIDSYGRDVDEFTRAVDGDSPHEYAVALAEDVDARNVPRASESVKRASAQAHSVSQFAFDIVARTAREFQRERFNDACDRWLRTHVDGAHVGDSIALRRHMREERSKE